MNDTDAMKLGLKLVGNKENIIRGLRVLAQDIEDGTARSSTCVVNATYDIDYEFIACGNMLCDCERCHIVPWEYLRTPLK